MQVHVSLSHGEEFSRVHSPAAMWVQSVTTRGFEVCIRETGIGTNGTGIINWLAFQDHPQMTHGSVTVLMGYGRHKPSVIKWHSHRLVKRLVYRP